MIAQQRMEALRASFYEVPSVASWSRVVSLLSGWSASEGLEQGLELALEHLGRWRRASLRGGWAMPRAPHGVWQLVEMSQHHGDVGGELSFEALEGFVGLSAGHWPPTGSLQSFALALTCDGWVHESVLGAACVEAVTEQAFDDETLSFVGSAPAPQVAPFAGSLYERWGLQAPGLDQEGFWRCLQGAQRAWSGQAVLSHWEDHQGGEVLDAIAWERHVLWRVFARRSGAKALKVVRQRYEPLFAWSL